MKTKNKLFTLLILSASAAAATAALNKFIKVSSTAKNILGYNNSLCFKWRFGDIYYTKSGSGKPLLLVHDLTPASSGYEWNALVEKLSETYTVYTIDLLGCGRSEKPNLTYTNYLYVQLLSDFIRSEIGHRTDVIATASSAALAIMACNNSPELFDRLLLINPDSLLTCSQVCGKHSKIYKLFLDLPILGTLLYHISSSEKSLGEDFRTCYFYNPYSIKQEILDAYHESSHLGKAPKALYSSIRCHYTNCNITGALKKIDNSIYLVGGQSIDAITERFEEFKEHNPAIEYTLISHTKRLPQLENPEEVYKAIQTYFS